MIIAAPDPAVDRAFARALLDVQHRAYAVEAELIGERDLPPLRDDEDTLPAWRGRWLVAWDGTDLLGAVAWRPHGDHVDIDRLMVAPPAMRRGVATTLLDRVLSARGERDVLVATGRENVPAVALYTRLGFVREADEQVPPGVWITRFRLPGSGAA